MISIKNMIFANIRYAELSGTYYSAVYISVLSNLYILKFIGFYSKDTIKTGETYDVTSNISM